jgi:hypothetical protein
VPSTPVTLTRLPAGTSSPATFQVVSSTRSLPTPLTDGRYLLGTDLGAA